MLLDHTDTGVYVCLGRGDGICEAASAVRGCCVQALLALASADAGACVLGAGPSLRRRQTEIEALWLSFFWLFASGPGPSSFFFNML